MRTSTYATRDADEGIAVLEQVYGVTQVHVAPEAAFGLRHVSTSIGSTSTGSTSSDRVTLDRLQLTGAPADALTDPGRVLRVAQVLGGALAFTDGTPATPGPEPVLLPPWPYASRWADLDVLTVTFDLEDVQAHAQRLLGLDAFRLEFTALHALSPAMSRHWSAILTHLTRDVLPNGEAMGNLLIRSEVCRSLATALLHAFPGTFLDRAEGADPRPAPSAVRRARTFIDEHLDSDIGVAEIAEAARLSPRGLQAAFRRELGVTPTEYLRTARLDAAREDLRRADPAAGDTVAAVAARWGFAHTGRFAAAYRERHGESPSATLRS